MGVNSSAPAIQMEQLTKIYKSRKEETHALEDLTLDIQRGEIFGYLGPNGAGKTTTIRLLLDLIRPTRGSARIFGMDVREHSVEIHRHVGYLPGELNLWKNRTADQVISYLARVREMQDLRYMRELAERLKLDTSKRIRDYSTGNKRKLGLVLAMMHKPALLILDEPTSGLDPLMQQTFNQMMLEVQAEGRTVFLSSHVLSEVQAICQRVGILGDGRLKAIESVERLTHVDFRWVHMSFRDPVPTAWEASLSTLDGVSAIEMNEHAIRVKLSGDFDPLLRVVEGAYIKDLRVEEASLEEIFLTYYGNGDALPVRNGRTQERMKQ